MTELPEPGDELLIDPAKCLSGGELLKSYGDTVRLVVTEVRAGLVSSISARVEGTDESVLVPWDEISPAVIE